MTISISVRVVDTEGDPVVNIKVSGCYRNFVKVCRYEKTDRDGWVEFEFHHSGSKMRGTIEIDGDEVFDGYWENEESFSFTVDD